MLKIIEGIYKRKIILTPKTEKTRPTSSRLRKSIFDTLSHAKIFKKNIFLNKVLDIYSGSGIMGIECISRGTTQCNFIDNSSEAINIINQNLDGINRKDKILITNLDATNPTKANDRYGLIFFDPPYNESNFSEILYKWEKNDWFEKDAICIYEKHKNTIFIPPKKFKIINNIIKGNSEVLFLIKNI